MKDPFRALYLHIPFCVRRCAYCSFTTNAGPASDADMDAYLHRLLASIGQASGTGMLENVETVYIGGGTPSFFGERRLLQVVEKTLAATGDSVREFTVEANPDSLDLKTCRALAAAGVNRISLGVQSLDDATLRTLGRIHDAAGARHALEVALGTIGNVSADVICGVMGQGRNAIKSTLAELVEMGLPHLSVYPLTVEEGTALDLLVNNGEMPDVDDDEQAAQMSLARELLLDSGLAHYEVASYARPGMESRHNLAYWSGLPYLGLGLGASSMLMAHDADELLESDALGPWLENHDDFTSTSGMGDLGFQGGGEHVEMQARLRFTIGEAGAADVETLSGHDALCEDAMLAMRTAKGIGPGLYRRCMEEAPEIGEALERAIELGLAKREADGSVVPTLRGWLVGNELYSLIWNCAR